MLATLIVKSSVSTNLIYNNVNCIVFRYNVAIDLVNQLKAASKEFDLKEKQAESATAIIRTI